jgi:hypothetical protein
LITEAEQELAGMTPDEMEQLYDQFQYEDDSDNYNVGRIVDHSFQERILVFKTKYSNDIRHTIPST